MMTLSDYPQGGDAQAISRIAAEVYGGYRQMFDAHGWSAPGEKLMTSASALIVQQYGSIRAFEVAHLAREINIWDRGYSVFFTSFWGWSPETWGTVGFSNDRGRTRRDNLMRQLTDPFITVCYVTSNQTYTDPALKGMIAGFYLVTHEAGDRDEFTHPIHFDRSPEKWRHSLRAVRAFSYLPETRLNVREFDPTVIDRARTVAAMGEIITDPTKIALLKRTPWTEVEVFTSTGDHLDANDEDAFPSRGMVPAGPASGGGYVVQNGTQFLPRELYVLRLVGDIDAYLGRSAQGSAIVKVGLSASPDLRRQSFQKAMPRGAFYWQIERTTRAHGLSPYASHAVAVKGEDAMKRYLAAHAEWLGGEFYLATEETIEAAWQAGCDAAQNDFDERQ